MDADALDDGRKNDASDTNRPNPHLMGDTWYHSVCVACDHRSGVPTDTDTDDGLAYPHCSATDYNRHSNRVTLESHDPL